MQVNDVVGWVAAEREDGVRYNKWGTVVDTDDEYFVEVELKHEPGCFFLVGRDEVHTTVKPFVPIYANR